VTPSHPADRPQPSDLPAPPIQGLAWHGDARTGRLHVLDQTLLPGEERVLVRAAAEEVVADIRRLAIRGAPLLGVAGAYALVLAARGAAAVTGNAPDYRALVRAEARRIASARPTAVNLARAVEGALAAAEPESGEPETHLAALFAAARRLEDTERAASEAIARHGAKLLSGRGRLLTHCNAGALVMPGLGTALAPIYALHHRGERVHVWVDETRPLLQGLRLTAFELAKAGVPHAVVGEGAAFSLMRLGEVDAAIVGADRICANGDVVNKVGTYGVALGCRHHGIPFYVAAPRSTFDPATPTGDDVLLEQRRGDAGLYVRPGVLPADLPTVEPAFDVTPAALVTAYVTEEGVLPGGATAGSAR
jgi:methylthioribose-1-phosphate isomerase